MNRKIQHTPEGVRDILNGECRRKMALEQRIHEVFASFGCRDIETPSFEYFDVFGSTIGTTPSNELYKFFDRDGNTLVLRPDFTPSIARAASRYYSESSEPIRLCYHGNTFVNHSSYRGRLKENTQMGVELIGDGSAEADAEVVAMAIRTLLAAGLKEFQVSLGNVNFFRTLAESAGLDENTSADLLELIRNKNSFGVWQLLTKVEVDAAAASVFEKLPVLTGGREILDTASEMISHTSAAEKTGKVLARLSRVMDLLSVYGLDQYVSIDLGMTSQFMYYTGIIFRGYTYGTGEAIIKGGRYDGLLEQFGKCSASIGFVAEISGLMNALSRLGNREDGHNGTVLVLGLGEDAESAIRLTDSLRREGKCAELRILTSSLEDKGDDYYLSRGGYVKVIRTGDGEVRS